MSRTQSKSLRAWGASSSIRALKNNRQSRDHGAIKNKQVRGGAFSPGNRFKALSQLEIEGSEVGSAPRPLVIAEEEDVSTPSPISVTETKKGKTIVSQSISHDRRAGASKEISPYVDLKSNSVWTPSSGKKVIEEALSVREDLMGLLNNKSIDKKSTDLFRVEKFYLESEIQDYSICPDHLLSEKMAIIEARIHKLKGLSPVKGNVDVSVAVKEVSPGTLEVSQKKDDDGDVSSSCVQNEEESSEDGDVSSSEVSLSDQEDCNTCRSNINPKGG
ncbi:hypothetical protein U1Q18_040689 [Sarracenia purpurea var. burkii]